MDIKLGRILFAIALTDTIFAISSYIDDINIHISALLSPFRILSKFVNKLSLMIF